LYIIEEEAPFIFSTVEEWAAQTPLQIPFPLQTQAHIILSPLHTPFQPKTKPVAQPAAPLKAGKARTKSG
jgi:hypothetical protein